MFSFTVYFDNGSSHIEKWSLREDIFCSKCGKKQCWSFVNCSMNTFLCLNCGWLFYFAERSVWDGDSQIKQRLEAIHNYLAKRKREFHRLRLRKKKSGIANQKLEHEHLDRWADEGGKA